MVKISACVVLYNKRANESQSIQSLSKQDLYRLFVIDNSTDERICQDNQLYFSSQTNACYRCFHRNIGISSAYNVAIQNVNDSEYLAFFDDDTNVPSTYYEKMCTVLERTHYDIAMPIVKVGSMIVSPCRRTRFSFAPVYSIKEIDSGYSGINSGLCINIEYAKNHLFNERLFLDYVDHDYFDRAFRNEASIGFVPEIALEQNLSLYQPQQGGSESRKQRLKIFRKDCLKYYSSSPVRFIYACLLIIKRYLSN